MVFRLPQATSHPRNLAHLRNLMQRRHHRVQMRQILTEQNGYLSREQSGAYYPAELLEYALYHPEHAQAYTMSVLILLQTAVWYR